MMEISTDMLQKLASRTVRPGEVYRMELTPNEGVIPKNDGDTSRNKYFVVMGVTEDGDLIGLVLINTEITPHVSQRLRDSHYKLKAEDYPFLQKDRYVCCGELKEITTVNFFKRFRSGAVATLQPDHLDAIRGVVAMTANVRTKVLEGYGII